MKTNRFTAKALDAALPALNETLAELGDDYRFVAGGRNGYTAVDLATPEQANRFCSARNLECGTPRECLAACHSYVSQSAARFARVLPPAPVNTWTPENVTQNQCRAILHGSGPFDYADRVAVAADLNSTRTPLSVLVK